MKRRTTVTVRGTSTSMVKHITSLLGVALGLAWVVGNIYAIIALSLALAILAPISAHFDL